MTILDGHGVYKKKFTLTSLPIRIILNLSSQHAFNFTVQIFLRAPFDIKLSFTVTSFIAAMSFVIKLQVLEPLTV